MHELGNNCKAFLQLASKKYQPNKDHYLSLPYSPTHRTHQISTLNSQNNKNPYNQISNK